MARLSPKGLPWARLTALSQGWAGWRWAHVRTPRCYPILSPSQYTVRVLTASLRGGDPLRSHSPYRERVKGDFGSLGQSLGESITDRLESIVRNPDDQLAAVESRPGDGTHRFSVTGGRIETLHTRLLDHTEL